MRRAGLCSPTIINHTSGRCLDISITGSPRLTPMLFNMLAALSLIPFYVAERKAFFIAVVVTPHERGLVFVLFCPFVYDIVTKIEMIRDVQLIILLEIIVARKLGPVQKLF